MLQKIWKLIKKLFVEENLQLPGPIDEVAREAARLEALAGAVDDLNEMRAAISNCVNKISYMEERITKLESATKDGQARLDALWDKA